MKLFIYAHLDEPGRALLRQEISDLNAYWADKHHPTPQDREEFPKSEICFGNVPSAWLTDPNSLRWMQLESVGFEYYQKAEAVIQAKGICLTNLRGMFARPAAETALAGLLVLLRGVDELVLAQAKQHWASLEVRPHMGLLHGRKALVLGLGSIGRQIRDLLKAFGCDVTCYARTSEEAQIHDAAKLDARLGEFSVVVNCLPNTPDTLDFFDHRRLARLSREAIFVNIGRGSTVDEDALVEVLNERRIAGAALDVFKQEPLPATHPLWRCPRTLIMHHTGGGYADELIDKVRVFAANLRRYQKGERLENQINLKRGY